MFGNLVNWHDFTAFSRLAFRRGTRGLFARGLLSGARKTESRWAPESQLNLNVFGIPGIRKRWNKLVTGDEKTEPIAGLLQRHFAGRNDLLAISLGSGTGRNEISWAKSVGCFKSLVGWELSRGQVERANQNAIAEGLGDIVRFEAGDVFAIPDQLEAYDVVLIEGALHHFSPLDELVPRMRSWLKPGGMLLIDEFVGPRRFQWTSRQMEMTNALLQLLPESYRRTPDGGVRTRVHRPSKLKMYWIDPSEAIESHRIPEVLNTHFEEVASHPYGGTLLHLLFNKIAHNFTDGSAITEDLLEMCFQTEQAALRSGQIPSDYLAAAYRR